jgi:septal ring factor EnvC (AmiA/AmiB activator)
VFIVLAGCTPTKPPTTGLDNAARALDAARNAGASTYAPLELRTAEDHLSQARAQMDKRDYEPAERLAQESQVDSELAAIKARLGKAREKVDARTRDNAKLRQDMDNGAAATPAAESQP